MNYDTQRKDNVTVIRIKDRRFDSNLAPDLKAFFLQESDKGKDHILVDLQEVEYVDSSGLGAILFGIRQLRSVRRMVKIAYPQPKVLTLIRIAKLDDVIEAYDNEEEALASFNG